MYVQSKLHTISNFPKSVKANFLSDSEYAPVLFDVFIKLLPEMTRYLHLVEKKTISLFDIPGERISLVLKSAVTETSHHQQ